MTYLDLNNFVSKEVLPEINSGVATYIDSEFGYIENEEDLEDLEYSEVPQELVQNIIDSLYRLADDCKEDYDFSKVDNKVFNYDDIASMVESSYIDYKELTIQRLQEEFERDDYFEEYYSESEIDY